MSGVIRWRRISRVTNLEFVIARRVQWWYYVFVLTDSTLTIRIESELKEELSKSPDGMAQTLRSLGSLYLERPLGFREGDLTSVCLNELEVDVAELEEKLWRPNGFLSDADWQKTVQHFHTAKALTHPLMDRGRSLSRLRGILLGGRLQLMLNDWELRLETITIRNEMARQRAQQQMGNRSPLPPLPPINP